MKVGCAAYSFRQVLSGGQMSLEEFIRYGYEMGLDGVELTQYYFPSTDAAYLKRIKRLALQHGIEIAGAAIGGAFAAPDEPRDKHIAFAKEWVDVAVSLGAPYLRVFAGVIPEGHTEDEAMAWCISGLREVIPYAEERGIVIALENHGGITSTVDQVMRIVQGVDSDWLRVNLDVGNYPGDPYREIAETAPHAVCVHAKIDIYGPQPVPLDYPRVIHILREQGFKGFLNIEYEGREDPKLAVPRFAGYLKSLVGW